MLIFGYVFVMGGGGVSPATHTSIDERVTEPRARPRSNNDTMPVSAVAAARLHHGGRCTAHKRYEPTAPNAGSFACVRACVRAGGTGRVFAVHQFVKLNAPE